MGNRKIQVEDEDYKEFVEDNSEKDYTILASKLEGGDEIVCPHDQDMSVIKNQDGTVSVVKKSFLNKVFHKC